jgi:hypothetical protein
MFAGCKTSPPTYEQALAVSADGGNRVQVREWSEGVFGAFLSHNLEATARGCAPFLSEGVSTTRFVVDTHAPSKHIAIYDNAMTPFSKCVAGRLQALEWPRSPLKIRYLPLEINIETPKVGPHNADSAIISITPSNKSLERTREK